MSVTYLPIHGGFIVLFFGSAHSVLNWFVWLRWGVNERSIIKDTAFYKYSMLTEFVDIKSFMGDHLASLQSWTPPLHILVDFTDSFLPFIGTYLRSFPLRFLDFDWMFTFVVNVSGLLFSFSFQRSYSSRSRYLYCFLSFFLESSYVYECLPSTGVGRDWKCADCCELFGHISNISVFV